jgi:hypothetical protein
MERLEICSLCGLNDSPSALAVWFVSSERRAVHTECWIAAYCAERERTRLPAA